MLDSVAWPRGAGSAHFDGVVADVAGARALIAVDVKSGQGVGTSLLDERLTPIAEQWANGHGLGAVEIEIDHRGGALTQETLQNEIGRLMREFRAALAPLGALPGEPVALALNPDTTIEVEVRAAVGIQVHGGVGNPAARTASILRVMAGHEAHKAAHARADQRPFVLIYVSPPGAGGADFRADNVVNAARRLAAIASDWWLGTVFLDWTAGDLTRAAFFRQRGGNWPQGLNGGDPAGNVSVP